MNNDGTLSDYDFNLLLQQEFDRQKRQAGSYATFVWIASTAYLYFMSEEATILSLSGAAFLIIGMFFAAMIFGAALYTTGRWATKALIASKGGEVTGGLGSLIGWTITLAWTVAEFMAAGAVFNWLE